MSRPSKRIRPPSVARAPDTQLMSVVLPEPFGPIRPNRSPALTWSVTRSSARKPPKRLVRPSTSSSVVAMSPTSPSSEPPRQARDPLGRQHDEQHEHHADDQQIHLRGDGDGRDLLRGAEQDGADHGPDPRRRAPD